MVSAKVSSEVTKKLCFTQGRVTPTQSTSGWLASAPDLSCFGTEPGTGDVLVGSLATGKILRLVHKTPAQATPFPQQLSQVGAFSDLANLTPQDGVVPYESSHLDGAESELVIRSDHSTELRAEAIAEVRRILKLHLSERSPK